MAGENPIILSVIIPAYNSVDCLERAVNSVRAQKIPNMEIILVDDGSTDNTGALCEKLALMDKRVKVFHKENGGSSSARNLGIEHATGQFLGFVDSDDYIEPDMYEKLIQAAFEENLLMVQTSRDEIAEDGTKLPDVCIPPERAEIFRTSHIMRELLLHRGDCSFCTRITEASLFKDLRFPEGELNEDFYLLIQMLPKITHVGVLPFQDYHVVYRMCSNSRTVDENKFPKVFTDIVVNADRVMKMVEENYPELILEAKRFNLYQRLDYMLHIPIPMMNGKNEFYVQVKKYLRKNKWKAQKNPFLDKKNKKYIFILGTAPRLARRIHRIKMKGKRKDA